MNPKLLFLIFCLTLQYGCIGFGLMNPLQSKPYTMMTDGERFGRDQLTNRFLVAKNMIPIKGWDGNEVISVLGQPQQVEVTEKDLAEDWYFVYYHTYHEIPNAREGTVLVRLYDNKVTTVATLS